LIHGDVVNEQQIRAAMLGVSGCFHLAVVSSVAQYDENRVEAHRVNCAQARGGPFLFWHWRALSVPLRGLIRRLNSSLGERATSTRRSAIRPVRTRPWLRAITSLEEGLLRTLCENRTSAQML
jgi:hypothetical protein